MCFEMEPVTNLFELEQRYEYHSEKDGIFYAIWDVVLFEKQKNLEISLK